MVMYRLEMYLKVSEWAQPNDNFPSGAAKSLYNAQIIFYWRAPSHAHQPLSPPNHSPTKHSSLLYLLLVVPRYEISIPYLIPNLYS
jgi:hypothetical protein